MRLVILIVFLGSFASFAAHASDQPSPWPPYRCRDAAGLEDKPGTYSGFYEAEFEGSSFKLSHSPCEVWLTGDVCPIFGKDNCHKGAQVKAYVTVEGTFSPSGQFGHLGMWERE